MSKTQNGHSLQFQMMSAHETIQFGKRLGQQFTGGEVLALSGDLGSGKTVLTRGIALGLGIPTDQVSSPTFTLIQEYSGSVPLIHVDLYRLEKFSEILSLGLEEYFVPHAVVIIEWAERFPQILPSDHLAIFMKYGESENVRLLSISGNGVNSNRMVASLRINWENRHRSNP